MIPNRILVIDDDPSWQELLTESIEAAGAAPSGELTVRIARSFHEANALLDREHFHLAFVDLRLKEDERELTGKRIAEKITRQDEGACVVIVTGHADVSTAITALREWNVLDFVLKDEWDAEKVTHLVRTGLAQSRLSYRSRYESSIDLLRGRQDIYSWLAATLNLFAPANEVDRPDRRLADFLNKLLDDLHPLLPTAGAPGLQFDAARRIASAQFWSKALGSPISVCMSRTRGFDCEMGASLGFNRAERVLEEPALGLVAAISTPAVPPFDSFAC